MEYFCSSNVLKRLSLKNHEFPPLDSDNEELIPMYQELQVMLNESWIFVWRIGHREAHSMYQESPASTNGYSPAGGPGQGNLGQDSIAIDGHLSAELSSVLHSGIRLPALEPQLMLNSWMVLIDEPMVSMTAETLPTPGVSPSDSSHHSSSPRLCRNQPITIAELSRTSNIWLLQEFNQDWPQKQTWNGQEHMSGKRREFYFY